MMVDLRAPTVDPRRSSVAVVLLDPRCNTFFIDETPGKTDTDDNNDIEASDNNGGDNNEALSTRKRKNSIKMSGNGEGTDNLINAPEWYRPDSSMPSRPLFSTAYARKAYPTTCEVSILPFVTI